MPDKDIENCGSSHCPRCEQEKAYQAKRKAEIDEFLAIRKAEAKEIDPTTAEVSWGYGQVLDPYGILDLPEDCDCVGRNYFARNQGSNIWVSDADIADDTWRALSRRASADEACPRDPIPPELAGAGTEFARAWIAAEINNADVAAITARETAQTNLLKAIARYTKKKLHNP